MSRAIGKGTYVFDFEKSNDKGEYSDCIHIDFKTHKDAIDLAIRILNSTKYDETPVVSFVGELSFENE